MVVRLGDRDRGAEPLDERALRRHRQRGECLLRVPIARELRGKRANRRRVVELPAEPLPRRAQLPEGPRRQDQSGRQTEPGRAPQPSAPHAHGHGGAPTVESVNGTRSSTRASPRSRRTA